MDIESIALKLQETTDRSLRNEGRIKKLEGEHEALHQLVTSVQVLATRITTMEQDVKETRNDVKTLTEKPGKRWDSIVEKIIWAVLSAGIAFLLARIGL